MTIFYPQCSVIRLKLKVIALLSSRPHNIACILEKGVIGLNNQSADRIRVMFEFHVARISTIPLSSMLVLFRCFCLGSILASSQLTRSKPLKISPSPRKVHSVRLFLEDRYRIETVSYEGMWLAATNPRYLPVYTTSCFLNQYLLLVLAVGTPNLS